MLCPPCSLPEFPTSLEETQVPQAVPHLIEYKFKDSDPLSTPYKLLLRIESTGPNTKNLL